MTEIQSIPTHGNFKDLTGKVFGRLSVLSFSGATKNQNGHNIYQWLVRCECGNEKTVSGTNLKTGNTTSCGCFHKQQLSERVSTHKLTKTATHRCWCALINRCNNPNNDAYDSYGGRGITVCNRWLESFENFLADMGPAPPGMSIDRFPDNNGNYEPENCRWATRTAQNRNTRRNKYLEFRGERLTVSEWAQKVGISAFRIHNRLRIGWSIEEALTIKPVIGQRRHSKGSSSKTSA